MRDWSVRPSEACLTVQSRRGFYHTNSHFDHLGPPSLALYSVDSSAFRATISRSLLLERISTPIIILHPNLSRGGRDERESERGTQLQSSVSDERRKIFMADNGDDVSGNSQDMSSSIFEILCD